LFSYSSRRPTAQAPWRCRLTDYFSDRCYLQTAYIEGVSCLQYIRIDIFGCVKSLPNRVRSFAASVLIRNMTAFLDRRRRLVELCLAFTSLWHICLASPVQIERPGWSNRFNDLQFLKRSTSNDASCPAGWLCEQQSCPANALCPSGEVCVDFEGTPACAPSGASWCALNPSTLQAVECVNGICWYVKTSRTWLFYAFLCF
jgi:hypothetical protein